MNGINFLFFIVLSTKAMHDGETPLPTIEPCWFGRPETGISGTDFSYSNTMPLGDCERACSRDRWCLAFSFETNTSECRLHNNLETVSDDESEYYKKNCTVVSGEQHTTTCLSVSFVDHGPRTEGVNVYTNFVSDDMIGCHMQCKIEELCSGYSYDDYFQECSLSNDNIFVKYIAFCSSCHFYEKTCQLSSTTGSDSTTTLIIVPNSSAVAPPQATIIPPSILNTRPPTNQSSTSVVQVSQLSSGETPNSPSPQPRTSPSSQPSSPPAPPPSPPTPQPLSLLSLSTSLFLLVTTIPFIFFFFRNTSNILSN